MVFQLDKHSGELLGYSLYGAFYVNLRPVMVSYDINRSESGPNKDWTRSKLGLDKV